MKNICVVQLTRLGDLIQTVQALQPLKFNRQDIHLHLVARKQFAKPLNFILESVFETISYIDIVDLAQDKLDYTIKNIDSVLKEINTKNFDVVINLSYSKSSTYLSSLIQGKHYLGMNRNEFGEISIQDKWSQFVFSSVMAGIHNPFSLVDVYKNIIGTYDMDSPHQNRATIKKPKKRISIHPFASDKKKAWSTYKWVEVIYNLSKSFSDYEIAILGGTGDVETAEQITSNRILESVNISNLVGKISLEESFQVLSQSDCFIGNDSVLSHLASLHETPILTISTGPVRPHESIPYKAGAITICSDTNCFPCHVNTACELYSCHKDISHNLVVTICEGLIQGKDINHQFIKEKVNVFHLTNTIVYKAALTNNSSLRLEEISSNELSYNDVLRLTNRIIFELYLGNRDYPASIPKMTNKTAHKLVEDLKIIVQLFELYNHGKAFAKKLLSAIENDSENIGSYVAKVQEVERLANTTKRYSQSIAVIVDFFQTSLKNSPGQSLKEIAQSYLIGFSDASNLTAMQFELLQQMVSPYIKVKESEPTV